MKNILASIISIFVLGAISSCNTTEVEGPELVSRWKLIEMLADPGDGSGTFEPVNSDKTIEFYSDSTIVSSGDLCQMTTASGTETNGTYSPASMTIIPENCPVSFFPITYQFDGANLILNYPCIEPCREKYEPVN